MSHILKKTALVSYTERNNPGYLQYEHLLNLREDLMCTLHDFTSMLLSVTVQDVELTVQDAEMQWNPVNLITVSY